MKKQELYDLLNRGPVILDGATGSNLQKHGLKPGVCPEQWILEHEDVFLKLQRDYVEAGSRILYAPTFTGNRIKLAEYGLEDSLAKINKRLVALSKQAANGKAFVAGDLTMTGVSLAPVGPMDLEELIGIYKEQASCLEEAGCDLFVVETMMSLAETRAAVIAIKEVSRLPVMVSMTYEKDGRTLYGTDPVTALVVLQSLGADVVGINCSSGPAEMIPLIRLMKEYAQVPLLAKANAGLPELQDGKTVYPMSPEEFASYGPEFISAGAGFVGGCCGTTPRHIELLAGSVKNLTVRPPENRHPMVIASERQFREISPEGNLLIIGERINPTGKKKLQAQLRAGDLDLVAEMAQSQEELGAHILDINLGTSGIDEKEMMLKAIEQVTMISGLPLCIDSSDVEVIAAALRAYPGRAMINSISLEPGKAEYLLPLVRKYGAVFILLPLSEKGLPENLEEKHENIRKIISMALEQGIGKDQVVVDGLVTTVGANRNAALETLDTIRYCADQLGLATTAGLSNISFGLPERPYLNAAFLTMAVEAGLTMAIANPSDALVMGLGLAADLLKNKKDADMQYIRQIKKIEYQAFPGSSGPAGIAGKTGPGGEKDPSGRHSAGGSPVFQAVLKGNRKGIAALAEETLKKGVTAREILDEILIPAINEVGRLFETQEYFLPQLISSATAMEEAIKYLEPKLREGEDAVNKPVLVIATVEGDIHDIGKNLVALMLRNYGYQVIDLGKDVPADRIIQAAQDHQASVIVLSALMTTTMMKMKDVISLRNNKNLSSRVIIGGAVTTQEFADEIGADGYSGDASEAVKLVNRLLGME
ncbi:MAG: homocysteine S-methyltransferase family protein [Eubacterium sp.]|nr:homocysteine S-methyltransferase family protein [Eubacterium sp.]